MRKLRWIYAELIANGVVVGAAVVAPLGPFRYHVAAMAAAQCRDGVLRGVDGASRLRAGAGDSRTLRNPLKSAIAFDMFFHVEHHLFPKVPTRHLPELAPQLIGRRRS